MRLHPYLGHPLYIDRGDGPYVYDRDGRRYLDFNTSNGATMLGHRHPAVDAALGDALERGVVTGGESEAHIELAESLTQIIPSAERVRFASTGTEATALALRLARHVTGRQKFLRFRGHFHGLSDAMLFRDTESRDPESAAVPGSSGIPGHYAADVVISNWNDPEDVARQMEKHGGQVAAIIAEPVWYNAGCIPPKPGFLEFLRSECDNHGALLIFDEVLSGFRMALGGAQEHYAVTPDITTLAKAIANGMPLSVIAGRADQMDQLMPDGPVAHSGTYSGHVLTIVAALATLDVLSAPGQYSAINATAAWFYQSLQRVFDERSLPVLVQGLGTRFGLYFGRREPVLTFDDAATHDHEMHARFVRACLERGVYFHAYTSSGPPGHAGFSLAHTREHLGESLDMISEAAATLTSSPSVTVRSRDA